MRRIVLLLVALSATACAGPAPPAVGWSVDPNYVEPSEAQLIIYGTSAEVDQAVEGARGFGWRAAERAQTSSGRAFALLVGPSSTSANDPTDRFLRWVFAQPVTAGIPAPRITAR